MAGLTVVNMRDLLREAQSDNCSSFSFLPLLGRAGFFVTGLSHLLSAYPKTGKTTLLVPLILEWGRLGYRTFYCIEEPESVWKQRMLTMPDAAWETVAGTFALGCTRQELLEVVSQREEQIIVIDTIRLVGISDENDNAMIHRFLVPFITACRRREQTLILVHHARKSGGEHGLAASGGHAFVGLVDVVLELLREGDGQRRRRIRGWGRVVEVGELIYEKVAEGLVCLGDPQELSLAGIQTKVLEVLPEGWQETDVISKQVGHAGRSHLLTALHALAEAGQVERDPPLSEGKKPGRTYKWRVAKEKENAET